MERLTPFYIFASEASYQQGFFLSPYIELVRDGRPLPDVSDSKVSTLLKFAADRGVRVYVLLHLGLPAFNFLDLFFLHFLLPMARIQRLRGLPACSSMLQVSRDHEPRPQRLRVCRSRVEASKHLCDETPQPLQ